MNLEVLRNARVPLLREHGRVLDSCVPPCGDISDDRLLVAAIGIVGAVRAVLVVALVLVVFTWVAHCYSIFARTIRSVGGRVGGRCIGGSSVHAALVLCRVWNSAASGTQGTDAI